MKTDTTPDSELVRQFVRKPCDERYREFFLRVANKLEWLEKLEGPGRLMADD